MKGIVRNRRVEGNRFKMADIPSNCRAAFFEDGYAYTFWEGDSQKDPELSKFKRGFVRVEIITDSTEYRITNGVKDITEVRNWYIKHDLFDLYEVLIELCKIKARTLTSEQTN